MIKLNQAFQIALKQQTSLTSICAFARLVGLGESTIRKYLAGSSPSLLKFEQIVHRSGLGLSYWSGHNDEPLMINQRHWQQSEGFVQLYYEDLIDLHPQLNAKQLQCLIYQQLIQGMSLQMVQDKLNRVN